MEKTNSIGFSGQGHPMFYELLQKMAELHNRKNHDYAGTRDPLANLRACTKLKLHGEPIPPFIGVLVRLQDKWDRILNFVEQGELAVKSESVEDTLMDSAVYSLLGIILLREGIPRNCTNCKHTAQASPLPTGDEGSPCRGCYTPIGDTNYLRWEPKDEKEKTNQ